MLVLLMLLLSPSFVLVTLVLVLVLLPHACRRCASLCTLCAICMGRIIDRVLVAQILCILLVSRRPRQAVRTPLPLMCSHLCQ